MVSIDGFPRRLLITGYPACRKTTFATWLESEHGYLCIASDNETDRFVFVEKINDAIARHVRVVVDYGFFPVTIPYIKELIQSGFELWWFDGDRTAAREAFVLRDRTEGHPASIEDFERYTGLVVQHWAEYQELFEDRFLEVILPDGTQLSNDERLAAIRQFQRG